MNRLVLLPLTLLMGHTAKGLPMADPIVVSAKPLALFSLSERRDSVAFREAKRLGVPWRIVYAVTHSENYSGDSTAVNRSSGAIGIFQIHPINFNAYPECYGDRHITDMARNSCVGIMLLAYYRAQEGSWGAALRRYLGFRTNVSAWMSYTDDIIDHMARLD